MAVTTKDLKWVATNKARQNSIDKRETTMVYQAGELISVGDKPTTKKPNKPFRNSFQAKNDFVAGALRAVMTDYFKSKHQIFTQGTSLIVRKSENDFVVKVSKLKFNIEMKTQASANPMTNQIISLINGLDGVYVVGNGNNEILVQTPNFQQYTIRITKKKERVTIG